MTKGPQLLVSRVPAIRSAPSQQYVIVVWGMKYFLVTDLVILLISMERWLVHIREVLLILRPLGLTMPFAIIILAAKQMLWLSR